MKPLVFKSPLPDNILQMLETAERKKLGKDFRTMPEIQSDVDKRTERDLHNQIENLLRLKGIAYLHQRMDRKSRGIKGWPDFTFSVLMLLPSKADPTAKICTPVPVAWEVKLPGKNLSPEQEELQRRMTSGVNAWHYKVIHSLQEAADDLKDLGV